VDSVLADPLFSSGDCISAWSMSWLPHGDSRSTPLVPARIILYVLSDRPVHTENHICTRQQRFVCCCQEARRETGASASVLPIGSSRRIRAPRGILRWNDEVNVRGGMEIVDDWAGSSPKQCGMKPMGWRARPLAKDVER
jgi:hypothetical protein